MYVLMIVPSDFPDGDAGAVRDMAFANIYMELGFEVILIGQGRKKAAGNYKGVQYYSLYKSASNKFEQFIRFFSSGYDYISKYKIIEKEKGQPSVIHINDISEKAINFFLSAAKQNKIPILHDSTEWYSPCEFSRGKWDKAYILKERLNRKIISKPIKVIAISTYLETYFRVKNIKSVRIPVIMDKQEFFQKSNGENEKISIVYAGSPGKKDYLQECIKAFSKLKEKERSKFEFHLYGINADFLSACLNGIEIPEIKAHGKVTRKEVIHALEHCDFSILLRPDNERYTKAGFPTKVVEAMMCGCAMICNISSDLGLYLTDDYNSIIIKTCSVNECYAALNKVSMLNRKQIENLKYNAKQTAVSEFDYRRWIETIKELITTNE